MASSTRGSPRRTPSKRETLFSSFVNSVEPLAPRSPTRDSPEMSFDSDTSPLVTHTLVRPLNDDLNEGKKTSHPGRRKLPFAKASILKVPPVSEVDVPLKRAGIHVELTPAQPLRRSPRKIQKPFGEEEIQLSPNKRKSPRKPQSPPSPPVILQDPDSSSSESEEWFDAPEQIASHTKSPTKAVPLRQMQPMVERRQHSDHDLEPFSSDDESIDGEVGYRKQPCKVAAVCENKNVQQPGMFPMKPPVKRGTLYSENEDRTLLQYILDRDNFKVLTGRAFWQEAELDSASGENRTWQSLKERFLKYICPNIKLYQDMISEKQLESLKNHLTKYVRL